MNLKYNILNYRSKKELITLFHASCGYMRALREMNLQMGDARYNDGGFFNLEIQRHLRERFNHEETVWWAIDPVTYEPTHNKGMKK
jgi:hypothetical protein